MARSTLHVYRAVLLWMVLETAHGQTITGIDNFVLGRNKSLTCSIVSGAQVDPNASFPLSWPINATKVVSVQEQTTTAGQINTYISTLTFTVDVKDNQVLFTCIARFNDSKTATWMLYVIKPPNKPIVTGPTEVIGDRNSSWTCVVDGGSTSAPNVFWQFENGSRIMTNNVLTANVYTDENKLEINNVTAVLTLRVPAGNPSFDLGCVYVHGASSTQDTTYISINVTYPPIVTVNKVFYIVNNSTRETIDCQASALPAVTSVTWYKNGAMLNVSSGRYLNGSVTTPSLTILSAGKEDTGAYICSASNLIGSTNSSLINVTVRYRPVVTYNNSIFTGILGTDLTLVCFIDAVPPFTAVTWWRIDNSTSTKSFINTTNPVLNKYSGGTAANPSLTILTLVSSDAGLYRCAADNDLGHGEGDDVGVQVFYAPVITVNTTSYTVNANTSLLINCFYEANPAATAVTWTKNTQNISVINSGGKYNGGNITSPSLTISQIASSDAGIYVCSVYNSIGWSNSQNITLTVRYTPEIQTPVTEHNTSKGGSVTLDCKASAYPPPTEITWYLNGRQLSLPGPAGKYSGGNLTTPDLTIYDLVSTDIGSYYCNVTNSQGSSKSDVIQLNVTYAPIITLNATSYNENENTDLQIPCSYDANPAVSAVRWTRNSQNISVANSSGKYKGANVTSPSLTISRLTSSDAGVYVCSAENSIGWGFSLDILLVVKYTPEINTTVTQHNTSKGESVTLECKVLANPPPTSVLWFKDGNQLFFNGTGDKYSGGNLSTPDLTIHNLVGDDLGKYYCNVTNSLGSTKSDVISLNVTYAPVIVSSNESLIGRESTQLTVPCTYDANPPPTRIIWTKNSVIINVPSASYTGGTPGTPSLTIASLVPEDAGNYVCSVFGILGNATSSAIRVIVEYLPRVDSGNSNITRRELLSVTIPCNFTAVPPVTSVTWLRDNNVINVSLPLNKYGGGNLTIPALTILNLRSTDVGMYKCKVTNNIGPAESRSVNLIVEYKPEISTVPEIVGEETSPVTIYCNVSAYPWLSSLVWYRNDQPLDTSNTGHFSGGSIATPSLTIARPGAYDEGIYYCLASNSMGSTAGNKTKLSVNYLPVFRIDSTEVSGSLGQSVILTVYVIAKPNVTSIRWLRSSNSTTNFLELNILGNSAKYGGGTKDSASLQIRSFDKSDEGIYVVEATNPVGPKNSSSFNVQISYPPSDLMIQGLTTGGYKEGESIVLTCSAKGLPPPQYRWYRSTVRRSDGAVLNITSATSADNTVFKCEALNTRGSAEKTVTVSVQYKPRPASNLTNETAAIGQTVQLTCETDSNPAPNNYTWYHNGQVVGTGSKTLTVTIKNDTMLGSYICVASNTQGQIDPPAVIYVTNKNDIPPATGASSESTGLSTVAIVLISIICIIAFIVIVLIFVYCCCAKKKNDNNVSPSQTEILPKPQYADKSEVRLNGFHPLSVPPLATKRQPITVSNDYDKDPTEAKIVNGHSRLGHGLSISLPGGENAPPRPHHLPPIGQAGVAEETEPAVPDEKKKKRRRRRREQGPSDSLQGSPQRNPDSLQESPQRNPDSLQGSPQRNPDSFRGVTQRYPDENIDV